MCSLAVSALTICAPLSAGPVQRIEVFTVSTQAISPGGDPRVKSARIHVYKVDGVALAESALSADLPMDANAARAEALRRIATLNAAAITPLKDAATGLATASRYGIDRYPAMVINDTAVLYGVTDLSEALRHYDMWHARVAR